MGNKLRYLLSRNEVSSGIEISTSYVCIWQKQLKGLPSRGVNSPEDGNDFSAPVPGQEAVLGLGDEQWL